MHFPPLTHFSHENILNPKKKSQLIMNSFPSSLCNDKIDTWVWLQSLPPLHQWKNNYISTCICSSSSSSSPSLILSICKTSHSPSSFTTLHLSVLASFTLPISLWTSKPLKIGPTLSTPLSSQSMQTLMLNFIQDILNYGPNTSNGSPSILTLPSTITSSSSSFKDSFNFSILNLAFLVCIYEAPLDLRHNCLNGLKDRLSAPWSREASRRLMRALGAAVLDRWMRSVNLAITNWKAEVVNKAVTMNSQTTALHMIRCPSPLFSYSSSTFGMWKLQLFCPVIAMEVESSSGSADEQLMFSLNYHHLEGVVQLNYKVVVRDKWVEVMVNTDNIRLSIVPLLNDAHLNDRGAGASEKHFPSRISLQLTPSQPWDANILSVSLNTSSNNPSHEREFERGFEGSFEPPASLIPALKISATETTTTSMKPWKFEESANGDTGRLSWFLHDTGDGREVFSSRPSMMAMFQPKAWFRNRYANVNRPFTRQGGVVFAKDTYGDQTVCWKVDKAAFGRVMEWEVKGCIGVTYWPNKHKTFYNETRRADFRDTFYLNLS